MSVVGRAPHGGTAQSRETGAMVLRAEAMKRNQAEKDFLRRQVVDCLADDHHVRRIVLFGSFLTSDDPQDMDVAVFQDSEAAYLPLALEYRRRLRPVTRRIPVDVIPVRPSPAAGPLLGDIEAGEVLYEG